MFGTPGQQQPQQQTGGGLFGSASPSIGGSTLLGSGAQRSQSAAGLFGASTQQPQSGLFGGSTAASQPARPSLLGLNTAAQAQTTRSSLFGASTAPAPAAQSSLFGQPATTAAQPSLFGQPATTTATAAPLGASILSAPNPVAAIAPSGQAATNSYFHSLFARSQSQTGAEAATEELPSLHLGLGDLRQKLRRIGPQVQDRPLDGKAHYLLAASGVDPGAAVRDLGAFGAQSGIHDRPLGPPAGELDVETYLSNLQTKTTLGMIADGLERSVRDFDSFLEENVTMEWEAQRKRIYQHFGIKPRDDTTDANIPGREDLGGFGRSRRSRQQGTPGGQRPAQKASAFGRSALQRSVIGSPGKVGAHPSQFSDVEAGADTAGSLNGVTSVDDRFSREKQAKLAEKIHALNDSRTLAAPYPILYELAEIESRPSERSSEHLAAAYRAVMDVVGEDPEADVANGRGTARQRQFARSYLDPNPNSANAISIRKRILAGASRHLERQFFAVVESAITKYQAEATQGGRPDVVSKIRAFVRVKDHLKELTSDNAALTKVNLTGSGEEFVWAVIFYLLRSGYVTEAATYVNENHHQLRAIDRNFYGYINAYAASEDRRLARAMQERCNNEYSQRARNAPEGSIDPFRMACYKIVGRCDVSNRSLDGFKTDVYDWIWLQFNLAREGDRSSEFANEMFGLAELQASVREVGLKHFPKNASDDNSGSFGMFFYMQTLAGLYEQAAAYLYSFSYVDAVHFGIALEYYGLLRAADALTSGNELLSHNTRGLPQINFARMVGYYTRDFRAADVAAAVDYLVLICLNMDGVNGEADQQQAALCYEALRELVLETREFSKLIGDIRPDGRRIRGAIEERGPLIALDREQDFIKTISLQAASYADDNGRTTDAVLLYHLAGDYDTVVAVVSRALSEAIALEIGEDPMRLQPVKPRVEGKSAEAEPGSSLSLAALDDPVELARTMMTMYERDQMFLQQIRAPNRVACSILLQMSSIKGLVEQGNWPLCLDVRVPSSLLPPLFTVWTPGKLTLEWRRKSASSRSSRSTPRAIPAPSVTTRPSSRGSRRPWPSTCPTCCCGPSCAARSSATASAPPSSAATRRPPAPSPPGSSR